MSATLIVRSIVPSEMREAFDGWYETEHLPDGRRTFNAIGARRGWSDVEPGVHYAFYEFPDLTQAKAALESPGITAMIAEYDRVWQGRIERTRDIVEVVQSLTADTTLGIDRTPD